MSFIQNKQNRLKIKAIFSKYSNKSSQIPNNLIHKFFQQLGLSSDLFFHDLYYYFPLLKKDKTSTLKYQDCLAFIDYIMTSKYTNKQILEVFKMFDKNGMGYVTTNDILSVLKINMGKQITNWNYQKYVQILNGYGSTINYIEMFQKNKWMA